MWPGGAVSESVASKGKDTYGRGMYEAPTIPSRVMRDSATAATRPSAPPSQRAPAAARDFYAQSSSSHTFSIKDTHALGKLEGATRALEEGALTRRFF